MVTTVGTESDLLDMLNNLIELEHDALQAYEVAIGRMDTAEYKARLTEFRGDHVRHIEELSAAVRKLGGEPATSASMKQVLTTGKVALAEIFGERAVLKAMKTNEDDTNTAYERAVEHEGKSADVAAILERNLADERRHRDWIKQAAAS